MFLNFIIIILVLILAYSIIPTYIYKFNHKLFKQDNKKDKSFYLTFDDGTFSGVYYFTFRFIKRK